MWRTTAFCGWDCGRGKSGVFVEGRAISGRSVAEIIGPFPHFTTRVVFAFFVIRALGSICDKAQGNSQEKEVVAWPKA